MTPSSSCSKPSRARRRARPGRRARRAARRAAAPSRTAGSATKPYGTSGRQRRLQPRHLLAVDVDDLPAHRRRRVECAARAPRPAPTSRGCAAGSRPPWRTAAREPVDDPARRRRAAAARRRRQPDRAGPHDHRVLGMRPPQGRCSGRLLVSFRYGVLAVRSVGVTAGEGCHTLCSADEAVRAGSGPDAGVRACSTRSSSSTSLWIQPQPSNARRAAAGASAKRTAKCWAATCAVARRVPGRCSACRDRRRGRAVGAGDLLGVRAQEDTEVRPGQRLGHRVAHAQGPRVLRDPVRDRQDHQPFGLGARSAGSERYWA